MTDLPQCLKVFRSRDRRTRIAAKERKLPTLGEVVPQRFQFDSGQHITRVPEEGNHFAVDVHGATYLERFFQDIPKNGTKGIPVDLPVHHELRHRRSRIKHYKPTGSTSLDWVDAGELKLGFESLTMRLRGNNDRAFPRSSRSREVLTDNLE